MEITKSREQAVVEELKEQVRREKIIAIVRGIPGEKIVKTVEALRAGGIRFVEVTFAQSSPSCMKDTPGAIATLCDRFPDLHIGAGTVLTLDQTEAAHKAGAKYIISPNTDESIIARTRELGMLSMPGALTPSEIVRAYDAGATFVKIFPAADFGAAYIKAVRAPISHIPMLAVGGISDTNMAEYYAAGVCGFGIGGSLVDRKLIDTGDFIALSAAAGRYVAAAARLS